MERARRLCKFISLDELPVIDKLGKIKYNISPIVKSKKVQMNAETRSEMFGRLLKKIPNPTTELSYSTSFELLVAVTLSAQATDKSVNQVTDILFPLANTPETIFELGETKLRDTIKSIGLFNSKAKHIIQTCRILIDKYNSEVPETRKELEALPGVGRKTANVVLNTAFGQPTIAVDTHIYRVANRTAIASGKTVLEVEKKLIKFIPDEFKVPAHHLMILHGRYVCKARSPYCNDCTLLDLCEYEEKNI